MKRGIAMAVYFADAVERFVADMLDSEFSAQMRLINERLLSAQNSGELDGLIAELRTQE